MKTHFPTLAALLLSALLTGGFLFVPVFAQDDTPDGEQAAPNATTQPQTTRPYRKTPPLENCVFN